eukprot:803849-Rhodomonas_salina.1
MRNAECGMRNAECGMCVRCAYPRDTQRNHAIKICGVTVSLQVEAAYSRTGPTLRSRTANSQTATERGMNLWLTTSGGSGVKLGREGAGPSLSLVLISLCVGPKFSIATLKSVVRSACSKKQT